MALITSGILKRERNIMTQRPESVGVISGNEVTPAEHVVSLSKEGDRVDDTDLEIVIETLIAGFSEEESGGIGIVGFAVMGEGFGEQDIELGDIVRTPGTNEFRKLKLSYPKAVDDQIHALDGDSIQRLLSMMESRVPENDRSVFREAILKPLLEIAPRFVALAGSSLLQEKAFTRWATLEPDAAFAVSQEYGLIGFRGTIAGIAERDPVKAIDYWERGMVEETEWPDATPEEIEESKAWILHEAGNRVTPRTLGAFIERLRRVENTRAQGHALKALAKGIVLREGFDAFVSWFDALTFPQEVLDLVDDYPYNFRPDENASRKADWLAAREDGASTYLLDFIDRWKREQGQGPVRAWLDSLPEDSRARTLLEQRLNRRSPGL